MTNYLAELIYMWKRAVEEHELYKMKRERSILAYTSVMVVWV
jgi:hypothetical protein